MCVHILLYLLYPNHHGSRSLEVPVPDVTRIPRATYGSILDARRRQLALGCQFKLTRTGACTLGMALQNATQPKKWRQLAPEITAIRC